MAAVDGMIDTLIEDGYVVQADTLEELAEGLGLPVDAFVAQVEKYNGYAKDGYDPDYYKEPHRIRVTWSAVPVIASMAHPSCTARPATMRMFPQDGRPSRSPCRTR